MDVYAAVEPRSKKKIIKGRMKSGASSSSKNKEKIQRIEGKWHNPCLNTDCSGIHRHAECPNSSKEKKREFFDK